MVVCGIVAEYNPFHRGHLYHIEETRRTVGGGDCAVVAVMSGNYVQRGDFAIFNKHARAEAACNVPGGPDLVMELPTPYSVASAERFSASAVYILDMCGVVSHLSFGSEAGDIQSLKEIADFIDTEEFSQYLEAELEGGTLYPAARQRAVEKKLGDRSGLIRSPNNILAVEYLRALSRFGSAMKPVTIKRAGAGHDSSLPEIGIASASHIRSMIFGGEIQAAMRYVPGEAAGIFAREISAGSGPISMDSGDQTILSQLRRMSAEDLGKYSDAGEGLNHRINRALKRAGSVREAADLAKTKRYTHSRIRRILVRAYLGITSEWESVMPPYIKVLAFNDTGRELLKAMKKTSRLPVIIKPADARRLYGDDRADGKTIKKLFETEVLATDLYMLLCPSPDFRRAGYELLTSPSYVTRIG
jgi:predicted nucleotidyltransferase